jgi:hypothetical protein
MALGAALLRRGKHRDDEADLERATSMLEAAANGFERRDANWSAAQNNLAVAHLVRAEGRDDPEPLRAAVAAFKRAQSIRTPKTDPRNWINTQRNIGAALMTLAERSGDLAIAEESVVALELAENEAPELQPAALEAIREALGVARTLAARLKRAADRPE